MVDTRFTAFNRVLEAREQSQLARELDTAESLIMQAQGVPYGANANVVICLLMSAYEFVKQQNTNEATKLLVRATHLVGQQMVMQLYAEIRAQGEAGDVAAGR